MNIAVIGAGYVGLVTSACFAELGNQVTCIDVDLNKIEKLRQGIVPFYEPGLETLLTNNLKTHRLQFMQDLMQLQHPVEIIFIAVGTPSDKEGAADIQYVLSAARSIGSYLSQDCIIVDKSTVPVGMGEQVRATIQAELEKRKVQVNFTIVSNPEFLREGAAIEDFMKPDRIIIGLEANEHVKMKMLNLYLPIIRHPERIYFMNVKDAEMTKYAANAMLATRISFMNEMAALCAGMGVDIENVRIGIGSDSRIGNAFLNPGCGYGGSCFPKDVRALIKMSKECHVDPYILKAVEQRNFEQKNVLSQKIVHLFGENLSDFTLGVWGLSFKPGTDDMREASSLVLIEEVIKRGGQIQAYDPAAQESARRMIPQAWFDNRKFILHDHQYEALKDVDALALITEWQSFSSPDISYMKKLMRRHLVLDGRNHYDPALLRAAGFEYHGIGR